LVRGSHIADYNASETLPCPPEKTLALANTKTRLKRLEPVVHERLINCGYAICDAAMRKWMDATLAKPAASGGLFISPFHQDGEAATYPAEVRPRVTVYMIQAVSGSPAEEQPCPKL
jgi:hypothetical protein